MSKTKEEIIAENVRFNGVCDTINYHGAMDEYASQALSDYKKQLEAKLVELKINNPIHDIAHSHNATLNKIINELL